MSIRPIANVVIVAALLCCVSASVSCQRAKSDDQVQSGANTVDIVPAAKVVRTDVTGDLVLTAEFEPYQEVDVMAKVSGYLREIKVDLGDHVRAGQVLATLEVPEMEDELAKAEATIQQADAEISAATDEVHRAESSHEMAHLSYNRILDVSNREPGLVPQQDVDVTHSKDMVAEAQVAAAKSNLHASEQRTRVTRAEKARLETLMKYTTIVAPFEGVVTKRFANTGAMIQAGTASQTQAMPIVRLSQNNLLRLILPVPESSVSRVRVGERVDVSVPSMGRTFAGTVSRFSDKVQSSTRTMDTEVDVPNGSLTLVPGMYAEVNLRIEDHRNVPSVPLDAIERTGDTTRVYVINDAGVIRFVPVRLGLQTEQRIEVRSGIPEGAVVVVGRHAGLKEGQRVEARFASTPTDTTGGAATH